MVQTDTGLKHLYKQWPLLAPSGHGRLSVSLCTSPRFLCFLTVAKSRFLPALITSSSVCRKILICPWLKIYETCPLSKHFFLLKEASFSGSVFVYCWLRSFRGCLWPRECPSGCHSVKPCCCFRGKERDISWFP